MSPSSLVTTIFAQATNAAGAAAGSPDASAAQQQGAPGWTMLIYFALFAGMIYFGLLRPQQQAKKKAEDTVRGAKTGDKIVTASGIHGVITNVKETTFILKIADNVKIEIEKSSVDKITRADTSSSNDKPDKAPAAKA
jgi:preprotein translocase subunit YajC